MSAYWQLRLAQKHNYIVRLIISVFWFFRNSHNSRLIIKIENDRNRYLCLSWFSRNDFNVCLLTTEISTKASNKYIVRLIMDTYLFDCKPTTTYSWLLFSFRLKTPSLVVSIDLNLLPETDPSKIECTKGSL